MSAVNKTWIRAVSVTLLALFIRCAAFADDGGVQNRWVELPFNLNVAAEALPPGYGNPEGQFDVWYGGLEEVEKGTTAEESRSRRFETIFFISLPASVLLSLLGVLAFRGASRMSEGFSQIEYQYIVLSSIGISLSVAMRDSKSTSKRGYR
jgi:hypothetical protein